MRNLLDFLLKYNYFLLFVLLEVICFILLFRFNNYQGNVFFTSANYVAGKIYDASSHITRYVGLDEMNRQLTARNVELEMEITALRQEMKKYTQDSTVTNRLLSQSHTEYRAYPARVVNNSVTHLNNYITINKGEADGIRPEMGVVSGNGVVGIVYLTGAHHSIILPVLNSKSSISCKIKRTEYFGFLKWEGGSSQYAYVKDMPRHSEFMLGDTIVTSGHSSVFPEGIPVGTVDDMVDSHDGLSYLLRVKLFTDFARLRDVLVVALVGKEEQTSLEKSAGL